MPITINGSGTVTGISAGGLPDGSITTDDLAAGAVTQAKRSEQLTLDTAKTATGTSVDFTGIPSWVKLVTITFSNVSLSGSANLLVQIGSGSFSTSGYTSGSGLAFGTNQTTITTSGSGYAIVMGNTANIFFGSMQVVLHTGTVWVSSHAGTVAGGGLSGGGHSPALGGSLDRVRITSTGADTFDAGSINILYE